MAVDGCMNLSPLEDHPNQQCRLDITWWGLDSTWSWVLLCGSKARVSPVCSLVSGYLSKREAHSGSPTTNVRREYPDTILASEPFNSNLMLLPPSIKTMIFLPLFLLPSGMQYDCHAYLASLPKYTLPIHPAFQLVICPHYFAECIIYMALMFIAAPPGTFFNKTISSVLMFVITNLGITAEGTYEWYVKKFGAEKFADRGIMVPYVW